MASFITRLDPPPSSGPRLAVKDLIDVAGVPTTAGCRAIARTAQPAESDAACLRGAREAGARIVGKTNLHELAMLPIGTNPWFGSPVNPLDPALVPGGSSSGSAVAVATDEADVALGSDTGGSVRIPSACCGTAGLKTTYGRVPLDGVWPLAPSLDTIGPMAKDIAGVVLGMQLLEPGFAPQTSAAHRIGRLKTSSDPRIEDAIDTALNAAGFDVVALDWDGFDAGSLCFTTIYFDELWNVDHELVENNPDDVGSDIAETVGMAPMFRANAETVATLLPQWKQSLLALFDEVELLALPTLPVLPPRLDSLSPETMLATVIELSRYTSPFNAAGTPCTAQPVPIKGSPIPASLQLVGPMGGEELLLATAATVESAVK